MKKRSSGATDLYRRPVRALESLQPDATLPLAEKATAIFAALKAWDSEHFGNWEDAVVVLARRKALHARNIYTLLAMVLGITDPKRAAEVGKVLSQNRARSPENIKKHIKKNGGMKAVSHSDHAFPPLTLKVSRATSR